MLFGTNQKKWIGMMALSLAFLPGPAFSDGGGSTGGGLAAEDGSLLDFYETNIDPLQGATKFDPTTLPAFQQRLLPQMKELGKKLPRLPKHLLGELKDMEWYFTDQPIADSNDECALLKTSRMQIAKQVGNRVVISRAWFDSQDQKNQAGVLSHEMLIHYSGKDGGQCSTGVREANRALFAAKDKSPEELKAAFAKVKGPFYVETRSELDRGYALLKPDLDKACSEANVNEKSLTIKIGAITEAMNYQSYYDLSSVAETGKDDFFTRGHSRSIYSSNGDSTRGYTITYGKDCERMIRFLREEIFMQPGSSSSTGNSAGMAVTVARDPAGVSRNLAKSEQSSGAEAVSTQETSNKSAQ